MNRQRISFCIHSLMSVLTVVSNLLLLCLASQEGKGGFPLPSTSAARFVNALSGETGVEFAHQFVLAALELSASDISTDANKFCSPWSDKSQAMYDDFWFRVCRKARAASDAAVPTPVSSFDVVNDSAPIDAPPPESLNSQAAATLISALPLIQSSSSSSSFAGTSPFRVLIVFDEANILAETDSSFSDEKRPNTFVSVFRLLRRALWTLKGTLEQYAALPVFMDTASHLSKFSPPLVEDDSNRGPENSSSDRISVHPPFSVIGSRPDDFISEWSASAERAEQAGTSAGLPFVLASRAGSSGKSQATKSVEKAAAHVPVSVAAPHHYPLLRGRPLWRAHFESKIAILQSASRRALTPYEMQPVWVELVKFAIMKLRGGRESGPIQLSEFESNPGLSASIGGCLLNLDIQSGSHLAARLAKSHMVRDDVSLFVSASYVCFSQAGVLSYRLECCPSRLSLSAVYVGHAPHLL